MGHHDDYGKNLTSGLLGGRRSSYDQRRSVNEAGVRADLDGVILALDKTGVECAVEIEARVYKQIRGALVDLALHSAPKKLLLVIKAQPQLGSEEQIMKHCNYVWNQITGNNRGLFHVAVLKGTGDNPMPEEDGLIIAGALRALAIQ